MYFSEENFSMKHLVLILLYSFPERSIIVKSYPQLLIFIRKKERKEEKKKEKGKNLFFCIKSLLKQNQRNFSYL